MISDTPTPRAEMLPDILDVHCPSRTVLRHVTDRWTPMIVTVLSAHGVVRFSELKARVGGISGKVLTETLRSMERDGFVTRAVTPSVPPRVDYALTDLGCSVAVPIAALREWAQTHVAEVEENRRRFDGGM